MEILETNQHLFCPAKYQGPDKTWQKNFMNICEKSNKEFTWDISAILSIVSFGYACGDRTLVKEIKRQPWISSITSDNSVKLEKITPHDFYWDTPQRIAKILKDLLLAEASVVCQNRSEIYVLLSGGLDSRIVASILVELYKKGKILAKPISLTWGLENSRDIVYAKLVAKTLGIENIHIDFSPQNIFENISASADFLGGLVSPINLHRMLWCKTLGQNALILNGSYGDSIGRAEFSNKHLLELDYLLPVNQYNLLNQDLLKQAVDGINSDLEFLRSRTPDEPKYALCENEMEGQYMRGLIGHSMSILNQFATVYHMFTAPEVYGYMWKLHPSVRNNKIYGYLLDELNPSLSEIPWSRTNKSINRKTMGTQRNLLSNFHDYKKWIVEDNYEDIYDIIDPRWFKETGIFNSLSINIFRNEAKKGSLEFRYDTLLWLCTFRLFSEKLNLKNINIRVPESQKIPNYIIQISHDRCILDKVRIILRQNVFLYHLVSSCRQFTNKIYAYLKYPPIRVNNNRPN